ncbi:hypothetical protein [Candidatus Poriferisodalis sp.]|uniref:hypothetical protein n=1 Tax=Candidatus Poriferisodalis sp. TaxID=3101277 RepID=UPI003AF59001
MMTAVQARSDEFGGAVSLLVVLMVPVCTFAAVVAMAVPQRLAAESSLDSSAEDLAALAAAVHSASGPNQGPLNPFFPDCLVPVADPPRSDMGDAGSDMGDAESDMGDAESDMGDAGSDMDSPESDSDSPEPVAHLLQPCETLSTALLEDLGRLGFDGASLRGFYSTPYADAGPDSDGWTLPCHDGGRTAVADAVRVGLVADWNQASWAAAQVWPSGLPMASEAIGRLTYEIPHTPAGDAGMHECGTRLELMAPDGRPAWQAGRPDAREFAESVPTRAAFGG